MLVLSQQGKIEGSSLNVFGGGTILLISFFFGLIHRPLRVFLKCHKMTTFQRMVLPSSGIEGDTNSVGSGRPSCSRSVAGLPDPTKCRFLRLLKNSQPTMDKVQIKETSRIEGVCV
jgi:hypothetical protein